MSMLYNAFALAVLFPLIESIHSRRGRYAALAILTVKTKLLAYRRDAAQAFIDRPQIHRSLE
jgi:hypothetical protein